MAMRSVLFLALTVATATVRSSSSSSCNACCCFLGQPSYWRTQTSHRLWHGWMGVLVRPGKWRRTPLPSAAAAAASTGDTNMQNEQGNEFNVNVETAIEQWSAQLKRKSSARFRSEETVVLGVRNTTEYWVDTLSFTIPTNQGGGLGLVLTEIAGGRQDGLGITIVSQVVEGGNAAVHTDIVPGDSIVSLERTIEKNPQTTTTTESSFFGTATQEEAQQQQQQEENTSSMLSQVEETTVISTECLGYDATVDAIANLPLEKQDALIVTVKRIRRRARIQVHVQYPSTQKEKDVTLELFAGENVRRALLIRGIRLSDPLAQQYYKAGGGGGATCGSHATCGVCAVAIVRTNDCVSLSPPPSYKEVQLFAQEHPTWRMACRLVVNARRPQGAEMVLLVNPQEDWKE